MNSPFKHKIISTEKSFSLRVQNKVVMETPIWINQKQVVEFIENSYETKVLKINSLLKKGKTKFRKRIKVTLPSKKKFFITVGNVDNFDKADDNNAKKV